MLALTRWHSYLGALSGALLLAACRPAPVVPAGAFSPSSREALAEAAARTRPAGYHLLRIRWRSDDGQVSVSGSGAVRVAPDSLRVDVVVRLGVGRGTLILAGDSVRAEPEDVVERWLPDRFALWAALGVIRLPGAAQAVERLDDGARTFFRMRDAEGRESIFELHGDTLAGVVRLQDGRPVARLELTRGADGAVQRARVTDLERGARFEVQTVSRQESEAFPREMWQLRP